jgi:putative CocE/NonD family hydrolase
MRACLMGDHAGLRTRPVRLHISGRDEWHEFETYPPGLPQPWTWQLTSSGTLVDNEPAGTGSDTYRYDPANPTPNLGGAIFAFTGAGSVDNAPLEARPDVLVYTGRVLTREMIVIGQCQVNLVARAILPHVDFFVRLNDVGPDGVSRNVCDGFVRVTPETPREADGSWRLAIALHATAHSFLPGHRLRLLVASGAHPRYARNMGTGEPINTSVDMVANEIEIIRDSTTITLPTYEID